MRHEGYLLVDHRASPGLPEDLAFKFGYDPKLVKEGKIYEAGTLTCSHCKSTVVKNPFRQRERNFCQKCGGKYICDGCAFQASLPDYSHFPFEKKVDLVKEGKALPILGSPFTLLGQKG